jgi:membrane-bound inhibitor of C-type lysozyme/uncharacterized membrane protein
MPKRLRPIILILAALALGCSRDLPPMPESTSERMVVVYSCDRSYPVTARFSPELVELDLTTRTMALEHVVSASGAKYSGEGHTFWVKGLQAFFETPEGRDRCYGTPARSPWEEARLRGALFRGIGQEPGWTVEIVPGRWIHYRGDYGMTNIVVPVPEPLIADGEARYHSIVDGHDLLVRIARDPCCDTMSGEEFDYAVTIRADGRDHAGCGRMLGAVTLP